MKKISITFIILAISLEISNAQPVLSFGAVGSICFDKYEFFDQNISIESIPYPTFLYGFIVGYELNSNIIVESGLKFKEYSQAFGFGSEPINGGFTSHSILTWQLPVSIKTKITLINNKLYLLPGLGLIIMYNKNSGEKWDGAGGYVEASNMKVSASFIEMTKKQNLFSLIETGISIDYQLFNDLILNAGIYYIYGFKNISSLNITYSIDDGNLNDAYANNNGDYLSFGMAVKYRIKK